MADVCGHVAGVCAHVAAVCAHVAEVCAHVAEVCAHVAEVCAHVSEGCGHVADVCAHVAEGCAHDHTRVSDVSNSSATEQAVVASTDGLSTGASSPLAPVGTVNGEHSLPPDLVAAIDRLKKDRHI